MSRVSAATGKNRWGLEEGRQSVFAGDGVTNRSRRSVCTVRDRHKSSEEVDRPNSRYNFL